jgi:hypothetical protein
MYREGWVSWLWGDSERPGSYREVATLREPGQRREDSVKRKITNYGIVRMSYILLVGSLRSLVVLACDYALD